MIYEDSRTPHPLFLLLSQKVTADLNFTYKSVLLKKIQMKHFQLLQKKSNFVFSRKQTHFPSDYNLYPPVDVQISNRLFN